MMNFPQSPKLTVFEINTWVWLQSLAEKTGAHVDLSSVPAAEWDEIGRFGFDFVWLMGVWERSPMGRMISNRNEDLLQDFRRALPDFQLDDNVGSAYCIRNYVADQHLGGPEGLAIARSELAKRGMRLVLDFVPNHVAADHPWTLQHPEYFIAGNAEDLINDPESYIQLGGRAFARGRDPYFPAWPDVVQLNAVHLELRQAAIKTVLDIAAQCDGVRCDMAMLVLNTIFERTWGTRAGLPPATEYWADLIHAVKKVHPNFLFIAEAYWDLEWVLQQQGFDFCYDKRLYDRLQHEGADSIRLHLSADIAYQAKLLRFIENHDEPRAASTFSPAREMAAALAIATLPGATLFHEGQFEGRRIRIPVFLGRHREEPTNHELQVFYTELLQLTSNSVFRTGQWNLCECAGWPDNASFVHILAWSWTKDDAHSLIVINYSDTNVQGRVQLPWEDLRGRTWRLTGALSKEVYTRDGNELADIGLHVELAPWYYQWFRFVDAS